MKIVGILDRKIYECVAKNIVTEDVIITDERIRHIMERHSGDYEKYAEYIRIAVEAPDYILETSATATALILKEIPDIKKGFRLIVRLQTSTDDSLRKNSVLTFQHIRSKEYARLIRNKIILYKRFDL